MNIHHTNKVHIVLPKAALLEIFDECDRYDHDETGGRIVGTFSENHGKLTLQVTGIIDPGPNARRSPVMLFQDGEHQEKIFRKIEERHPETEHLGTWHTHHVNGLNTLSGGDITTYRKTVNHPNQNTPFFYALLVIAKQRSNDPADRYSIKHFIFWPGDDNFHEISSRQVEVVDEYLVWPQEQPAANHGRRNVASRVEVQQGGRLGAQLERVYDKDILAEFYQDVRPFSSPKLGFYWRGKIELLDGSELQVVLVEDTSSGVPRYSLVIREAPTFLADFAEVVSQKDFSSARVALLSAERHCNRILYQHGPPENKPAKH